MIEHVHALQEGYQLQEYTITGTLGFGGFGITYSARDNNLHKVVAIKEYLPSELAVRLEGSTVSAKSGKDKESFDWGLKRFLDEARAVARFDHPNIIGIHRFFEQNSTGYIVMEFIDGRTLSDILKEAGTLEESQIRAWLWPVMDGLKDVHAAGFLHRDIKPQNIIISTEGTPVLLDFGAARMAVGGSTRSLTAIMTPGFAPLEQYQSTGNQGPWTDIYSLGAVMYSCIAGRKPRDVLDRVSGDSPQKPQSLEGKTYSIALLQGIQAALALDEANRPRSIDDWLKILDGDDSEVTRIMPRSLPEAQIPDREDPVTTRKIDAGSEPGSDTVVQRKSRNGWPYALALLLLVALALAWWMNQPAGQTAVIDETVLLPPQIQTDLETDPLENTEQAIDTATTDQADQSTAVEPQLPTSEAEQQFQSTAAEPGNQAPSEEQELQAPEAEQQAQSNVVEPEDQAPTEEQALQTTTAEAEASVEPAVEGFSISSRPAGSSIYIDGAYAGTSPLEITNLEAGQTVTLRVEAESYQSLEQTVRVPSGQMLELDLELEKIPERFALTIDTNPPAAKVRILNIEPHYQPAMLLEPGQYHIEASHEGFITHRQWIEITDRMVSMAIDLEADAIPAAQGFDLRSTGQYDRGSNALLRPRRDSQSLQPGIAAPGIDNPELVPTVTVRPVYPRDAAMAGIEGWVQVEFTLTELGMVKDPIVINSQPPDTFDQEALRTILKWRYRPIVENGTPISKRVIQTIDFSLDDWQ